MTDSSFALRIADADLAPEPLTPEQIVSGTPEVTGRVVWESADGRRIRGIWQITPGVVTDTEADEMFVVISGSATVGVEGGPTLRVGPGDMAVLRERDQTTWTVHETDRKLYALTRPERSRRARRAGRWAPGSPARVPRAATRRRRPGVPAGRGGGGRRGGPPRGSRCPRWSATGGAAGRCRCCRSRSRTRRAGRAGPVPRPPTGLRL